MVGEIATPKSGPEKGVITKGGFSLEESLESLKSLISLQSLENGRILVCFSQSEGSLQSLNSPISLEYLEMDFSEKTSFPKKTPFSVLEHQMTNRCALSCMSGVGRVGF